MYPQLNVYLDDSKDPVTVQPLTVDMECYEQLIGAKRATDAGLRLVLAYIGVEGNEPKNLDEVKKWGRDRKVVVMVGEAPKATPPETSDAS
jgi:hypothetical protein